MKVVINACYGGFGLSDKAEDLYAEKSGFELFRYHKTLHEFRDGVNKYERVTGGETIMCASTFKKDQGDTFSEWPKDGSYWYSNDIERDDKILISVIEELGSEVSSGKCAALEIVEVPDDASWEISEYDGNEHVAESHRTWG